MNCDITGMAEGIQMLRKLIRKFFFGFDLYKVSPPYEYVQNITERHLGSYLNCDNASIKRICIVGGYLANEVKVLRRHYPNATFDIFECSRRYAQRLEKKFLGCSEVRVHTKAVGNQAGEVRFFETSLRGSGSLLELGELAKKSYDAKQAEMFVVEGTTLDDEFRDIVIDLLWIDVQGAELLVLEGGVLTLEGVKSIFIEVSQLPDLYLNGATLDQIMVLLQKYNFDLFLLGLDKENLTGNALFVRREAGIASGRT